MQESFRVDHKQFTSQFTKEAVYLLGYLWADGSFYRINNNGAKIRLSIQFIDGLNILKHINKTGDWSKCYQDRSKNGWQNQIEFSCHSRDIYNFIAGFNYLNRELGTNIMSVIPPLLQHYWYLGFIDGDGCWYYGCKKTYYTRQMIITSSLNQNWDFMINKFTELGCNNIYIKKVIKTKNSSSYIRISNYKSLIAFGEYIYQDTSFCGLNRKYVKYNTIKNSYKMLNYLNT